MRRMTKPLMTKAQYRAWKARWRTIREFEIRELRALTPVQKMEITARLMADGYRLGWHRKRRKDVVAVRDRWNRYRARYRD